RRMADADFGRAEQRRAKADKLAADADAERRAALANTRDDKQDAISIAKAMTEAHMIEHMRKQGVKLTFSQADRENLFSDLNERLYDDSDLEALEGYALADMVAQICPRFGTPFNPADWPDDE